MGKLETHGYRGWWPMLSHRRKYADGTMAGRECFVNMATGEVFEPEKGWSTKDLPYPTGEISSLQHQNDIFRARFDQIDWNVVKLVVAEDVRPEIAAQRNFLNHYDDIRWNQ